MKPTTEQKVIYEQTLRNLFAEADNFLNFLREGNPLIKENGPVIMNKSSLVIAAYREQSMVGTVSDTLLELDGEFNKENPDPRPALEDKIKTLEKELNDELIALGIKDEDIEGITRHLAKVCKAASLAGIGDGLNYIISQAPAA